jgi:hypothetical protein
MGLEYRPVMPPAQRLAGLDVFAGRMPAQHEAIRTEMETALRDPKRAAVEMPRSADHWADCLIAAKDLLEVDRPRGVALMRGPVGNVLVMGAAVALLHVEKERNLAALDRLTTARTALDGALYGSSQVG